MPKQSGQIATQFPLDFGNSRIASFFVGRTHELRQLHKHFSLPGQSVAFIVGESGVGKTALARVFANASKYLFDGGIFYSEGFKEAPAQFVQRNLPEQCMRPTLLVIDDAEEIAFKSQEELRGILAAQPKLSLLMAGRSTYGIPDVGGLSVQLGSLSEKEFKEVIAKRLSVTDQTEAGKLRRLLEGNPLIAQLGGRSVRDGLLDLANLFGSLSDFEHPGILGPDGQPVSTDTIQGKKIIAEVTEVNEELLLLFIANPSEFHGLSPRKFEEIVAEILMRQGYEVELTPASKDGGFDIYAARKEKLGEFLFLVECKKFAPTRKVGVEIVRALHGVVQQKRATAGIVATTSFFTKGAKEFRREVSHQMTLADYMDLQSWLQGIIPPKQSTLK